MEQARYWMWTKRKHDLSSHVLSSPNPSYGDSWEEQAFAEDAAGALGGCVWPPRSYTCSFCRREFRSAQALGGHMNVHRRDRARLKQSPTPQSQAFPHNNNILNTCNPLEHQYQPLIRNFLYNPSSDTDHKVLASPSSTIKVSGQPTKANSDAKTLAPCFFPIVEERCNNVFPSFPPWSNLAAEKYFHATDMKNEQKKSSEMVDSNSRAQGQQLVKADLSVSLNLVICRNSSSVSDAEEVGSSFKRRRIDEKLLTFFPKQNSVVDRSHPQADVAELNPSFRDDVDLELRLGDPPKVK